MKIIIDKYSKFLFKISLIVLAIVIVYMLIPKYQIVNNSGSIWKLNKVTGQMTREYTPMKKPAILKPSGYGN